MLTRLFVLACACLITLTACWSGPSEPRLQGTWRSNKDETVTVWRHEAVIPTNVIDRFENEVLGKMTVTYSGQRVTSTTGSDWTEVGEYHVVDSGDDFVVLDQFSDEWNRTLRWKVTFVEDGYWISSDEILQGYTEKFDLISR